jgi:hypothetical protein
VATLALTDSVLSTSSLLACTEAYANTAASVCNTGYIYESYGNKQDPQTDIVCGSSNLNGDFYRSIPASLTELVSTSSSKPTACYHVIM